MRRLGNKYQEYFQDKMDEYDIDSPKELSENEKKEFFDDVDDGWEADVESDGKISSIVNNIIAVDVNGEEYLDTMAKAYKMIVMKHPELRKDRTFQKLWGPLVDWVTPQI